MSDQHDDALAAVAMRIEADMLADADDSYDDVHPGPFERMPATGRVTMHDVSDRHGVRWQTAVDSNGAVIASTPIDDLGAAIGPRS